MVWMFADLSVGGSRCETLRVVMLRLNISPSVPLHQSHGGGVYGHHHGGSEGSNPRAGEADTERRPIQVSDLHGEYARTLKQPRACRQAALNTQSGSDGGAVPATTG